MTAISEGQMKQRERYNKRRYRKESEVGDIVVAQRKASAGGPRKIVTKYKGPYIISKTLSYGRHVI